LATNTAETSTILEARLILLLKQQKNTRIAAAKAKQRIETTVLPVWFWKSAVDPMVPPTG
jgi:hypothetical protein